MQKKISKENLKKKNENGDFLSIALELLSDLPPRSQEIVQKRFGFFNEKKETLEKIGKDYGITRERIRQIIADAHKKVAKKKGNLNFEKIEERIIFTINKKFGIIKKSELAEELAGGNKKEANAIIFLCNYSDKILKLKDDRIREALTTKKDFLKEINGIHKIAQEVLEEGRAILDDEEIIQKISKKIGKNFSSDEILSYLYVSKKIEKNNFGKWGVFGWLEINPKGTREKIYTILKEKKKPLHFREIAKIMDEANLAKKKAHPQTIHNELIKNEKFVLIGRGTYALREWGYSDGTVRDVLNEIFKKSGKALSKEEVLKEVMKIRKVKKATVMINLGNDQYFSKKNGLYFLKK